MRQFASSGFRIWNLSREAKLVYTGFGVFTLLAIASSIALYEDNAPALGPRAVGHYYRGGDATATIDARQPPASTTKPSSAGAGPALELPAEPAEAPLTVAMPPRKLLEVTHFHLFTVPVFLLIVAHLFMLTGLSTRAKSAWIVAGWLSALAHVGAPWIVRYVGSGAGGAWLFALSGALFALTSTVLTGYPIVVMWLGKGPRAAGGERTDAA